MAAVQQISHVYPLGTRINGAGHLEVGGCDVVELAREHGTPAYLLAEEDLRARARAFVEAFAARHDDFEVIYASKALPCTAVYRVMAEEGLACDVASAGELHLAMAGGFDPARVYLHGNAKDDTELRYALDAGVGHVVIDSFDEIARLERLVCAPQRVLIRVVPGIKPSTHDFISTGQLDTKFGFGIEDARVAIERVRASEHLELVGLHMHIGSQIFELEPFRRAVEAIAPLGDFPVCNVGGGLGVAYTAADAPPPIEEWVDAQVRAVHDVLGPGKRILVEPGRALVANAGVTIYRVVAVKRNVSTYVAVDGGMSDNLRPMLYGSLYEAGIADRIASPPHERCHVAGKHCESGDVLIHDVALHEPRAGDVLVTPATGAYGHALANNYNGVPRPPVIFCRDGEARVVVRRERLEDLTARDAG
jgi:diaminopimelate decarboxylase